VSNYKLEISYLMSITLFKNHLILDGISIIKFIYIIYHILLLIYYTEYILYCYRCGFLQLSINDMDFQKKKKKTCFFILIWQFFFFIPISKILNTQLHQKQNQFNFFLIVRTIFLRILVDFFCKFGQSSYQFWFTS
jgi:hypothetical protein